MKPRALAVPLSSVLLAVACGQHPEPQPAPVPVPAPPVPPPAYTAVDLVPSAAGYDANGFMIDPMWRVQVDSSGRLPDVSERCEGFVRHRTSADRCTSQADALEFISSYKYPKVGKYEVCAGDPDHVNWRLSRRPWAQSATVVTGRIYFRKAAFDGDINLFLRTPGDPGRTAHDPKAQSRVPDPSAGERLMEMEYLLTEFTSRFRDPWWDSLHVALKTGDEYHPPTARKMIDGRMAVAIGIYGLDGVHGLHSELHPVMALAIWTVSAGRNDTWQVFARNWGSEGQCSKNGMQLSLPDDTLRLQLPWRPGADSATVRFKGFPDSIRPFTVRKAPLNIPFRLGSPDEQPLVEGRVEIVWHGAVQPGLDRVPGPVWPHDVVPNSDDKDEKPFAILRRLFPHLR